MVIFYLASEQMNDHFCHMVNLHDICETQFATETIHEWKSQGCFTAALSGGFDLLTLNHICGLVQARLLAAAYALGIKISEDVSQQGLAEVIALAESSQLKLLVSVDTNAAISQAKSHNPKKGGTERPLLDWATRAKTISMLSMPEEDNCRTRMIVDCITAHGAAACKIHEQCLVEQPDYEVFNLKPDVTIMKNKYDIGDRPRHYSDPSIILFDESIGAYSDKLLETQISTTAIIRRIQYAQQ